MGDVMVLVWFVIAVLVTAVTGLPADIPESVGGDDWVVVSYDVADEDPAMLRLLGVEVAADQALQTAGVGMIDGNEIGQGTYDMYFAGTDRNAMWDIIEPVLAQAPEAWTTAELRDGLDDPSPIIIDR